MNIEQLNRLLSPIKKNIAVLFSKSLITKSKDVENAVQRVGVDLGNDQFSSNVERLQPFGLSANPKEGAEALVISVNGNRDHQIVIAVDDSRYRVKVNKGDVALYNKEGMVVELRGDEILIGQGIQQTLTGLDGVVTGQLVDTLTGIPLGLLPGNNQNGFANSLKMKVQV